MRKERVGWVVSKPGASVVKAWWRERRRRGRGVNQRRTVVLGIDIGSRTVLDEMTNNGFACSLQPAGTLLLSSAVTCIPAHLDASSLRSSKLGLPSTTDHSARFPLAPTAQVRPE